MFGMGEHHDVATQPDEEALRAFTRRILDELEALELMLEGGRIESGIQRIGAEQEMFLVDQIGRPSPVALEVLERAGHHSLTTELASFNLEANLAPLVLGGDCLSVLAGQLEESLARVRAAARHQGADVLLTGILPTLRRSDLGLHSLTPHARYHTLNDAMRRLCGGTFHTQIAGVDELHVNLDNIMLEAANTSFQLHLQVDAGDFARLYNWAQVITAPLLAASANSPLLLGKRLWHETRVAVFQQSVDVRTRGHQERGVPPRVNFGERWVRSSVLEVFRDDLARFRVLMTRELESLDPREVVRAGGCPDLAALCFYNGTIYPWNRPCYGVADGVAHLRIENRVLPAGPTLADQVANAALFYGLMVALPADEGDVTRLMDFPQAKANFYAAARHGLGAQLRWIDGRTRPAGELLLELVERARAGLRAVSVDEADVARYLDLLEARVRSGRTGAQWTLDSLAALGAEGHPSWRLGRLTRIMSARQQAGEPVHTWEVAHAEEAPLSGVAQLTVGELMSAELFTVRSVDLVDLAASVMQWRHLRQVPVEDEEGRLVGLITHRDLLRHAYQGTADDVAVADIMGRDPPTAPADMSAAEAVEKLLREKASCLLVVEGQRLVGIVTEADFAALAARLLAEAGC
jgi:CBS domain-containing protein/gamma-glutamyl:cysteine ligase YbdK (ATP-grasp superfamily)